MTRESLRIQTLLHEPVICFEGDISAEIMIESLRMQIDIDGLVGQILVGLIRITDLQYLSSTLDQSAVDKCL